MKNVSKHIELQGMPNTRDLGGMLTASGQRIKSGLLFRSGHTSKASSSDVAFLEDNIDLIVDFRSTSEKTQQPDAVPLGVNYLECPILDERAQNEGVARDYKSIQEVFRDMEMDPNAGKEHMIEVYRSFITNEVSIAGYRIFLETVLNHPGKGVLWHCSAGKDRCGFASVLIETILGVKKEDIFEDYLMTNVYNKEDAAKIIDRFIARCGIASPVIIEGLKEFWSADCEFLQSTYDMAEKLYGSLDGYIEKVLGISEEKRSAFRKKFLES